MDQSHLRDQLEMLHRESYGWALGCCSRDPIEAENVLQAVYLKVLEGKARFDGRAQFKTWLFSVIRKTAAEQRRRKFLRAVKLEAYREKVRGPDADSADRAVYRSQLQALLEEALSALPRRQREVLRLVFYHDLSVAEAASVMGVSVGSARKHYDRGKARIGRLMAEVGVSHEP